MHACIGGLVATLLASVVQKVNNAIHQINLYSVNGAIGFPNTYLLDSDVCSRLFYPWFEQPGLNVSMMMMLTVSLNFIVALQSFKFDGKLKPLLSGKMKQYGFFALCTAVNPANPFTSTPKELLQVYSCKLGMDLRLKKLDNR